MSFLLVLSCQISAVPNFCCIVTQKLDGAASGVFYPVEFRSSCIYSYGHATSLSGVQKSLSVTFYFHTK